MNPFGPGWKTGLKLKFKSVILSVTLMAQLYQLENLFTREWLQTNSFGSFALGCVDRVPRRKYHSLLTVRDPGFGEPLNVLTDVLETLSIDSKKFLLYAINYNGHIFPQGFQHLVEFHPLPFPCWMYQIDDIKIERRLELDSEQDAVRIHYVFSGVKSPISLTLEPLLAFRPMHHLAHENPFLNGAVQKEKEGVSLQPYSPLPRLWMQINGQASLFQPAGRWNRNIFYTTENERGYNAHEDLFCPGQFKIEIKSNCSLTFQCAFQELKETSQKPVKTWTAMSPEVILKNAASQFLMKTKEEFHTAVAGYPWFGGWSRDTLIALPGLCLSTGRFNDARQILENFGSLFMQGLMPNTPPTPEQNQNTSVDAPLLYIRAVQLFEKYAGKKVSKPFMPVVYHLLNSFKQGVHERVKIITEEGLIFVTPGAHPMTWMDAVVDGQIITPRFGFAIDLNALFYNAVRFALDWAQVSHHSDFIKEWLPVAHAAESSFLKKFWSEQIGYLADTHDSKIPDFSLRPNQLWAIALPFSLIPYAVANKILEAVRTNLLTPVGLRTLAPTDPKYKKNYQGGQRERDFAYHQGTVWPWLLGIYAEAVMRIHGTQKLCKEMNPILKRMETHLLQEGCLGQISEVFDAEEPHLAGGTPAQAWSVAEVLRVYEMMTGAIVK